MKKNKAIIFVTFVCVLCVAAGIFAPQYLLQKGSERQEGKIVDAPDEYYVEAGSAMARKASERLTALDRMKLVYGLWESDCSRGNVEDAFLTETQAVELAKSQMELFYQAGLYPYSLTSKHGNWYSFDTEVFQYTDSNFHTYTAGLWKITFSRFDQGIVHEVYMTESGTVLMARVNVKGKIPNRDELKNMDFQAVLGISGNLFDMDIRTESLTENVKISLPVKEDEAGFSGLELARNKTKCRRITATSKDGDVDVSLLQSAGNDYYVIAILMK